MLQGSEKLWGAAAHAVMAVAQQRGWKYGNHYTLRRDGSIDLQMRWKTIAHKRLELDVAEKFHANFYHNFMEDSELDMNRPLVQRICGAHIGVDRRDA